MLRFVAFDLDGVLYSAEPFLGDAYRDAIAAVEAKRPGSFPRVPTTREILDHVGWPVPEILRRLFPAVDPEAVELLYGETLGVIADYVARRQGTLFPGVADTLAALAGRGLMLGVASNGRRHYVETVLRTYDLSRFFVELIAVERGTRDDKASVLRAYFERLGVGAAQTVMVGDRASDVEAAQAVGCAFIGCDYGHGYRAEIAAAGPTVASFAELPEAVARLGR